MLSEQAAKPDGRNGFCDYPGVEVDSAGLNNDAMVPLAPEQIEWADLILVMERAHQTRLNTKFRAHLCGIGGESPSPLALPEGASLRRRSHSSPVREVGKNLLDHPSAAGYPSRRLSVMTVWRFPNPHSPLAAS